MKNELLLEAEKRIVKAYGDLRHDQGWSFLYTPGKTLSSSARFLFMGLNPAGEGKIDQADLTTEAGNAYHPKVEKDWPPSGKSLQAQVVLFYDMLAEKMGYDSREMMDSTLAANFCPFRSKSWKDLKEQKATITFCNDLWSYLIKSTQISTIVCMSSIAHQHMASIIVSAGGKVSDNKGFKPKPVGWGNVSYSATQFLMDGREICLIRLPHLSRYKIFGRDGSSTQVEEISGLVANSLNGWIP